MISVIGAGPAGSHVAKLLAGHGHDVSLFEEHDDVGFPVQCTGILTGDFKSIVNIDKGFLLNRIKRVRVHSPNNRVDFKLRNENYVFDREKFDKSMAEKAVEAGAKLFLNHKFIDSSLGKKIKIKFANGSIIKTDYLVGADGPRSSVAKSAGIYGKRNFTIALQANVKGSYEKDLVDFYIDERHFGWAVPENDEIARVGVTSYRNTKEYFDKLMGKVNGKTLSLLGGVIPVYNPRLATEKNNVFLVGDAATQVKTSTHGGIIPGLIAGKELVRAITGNESYEKLWKRKIGKDLMLHLMIRKVMDKFSVKDCDELVEYCKASKVRKLIEDFDREFPTRYIMKMALAKPALLKYGMKLFNS